jgi:hypothetical protein
MLQNITKGAEYELNNMEGAEEDPNATAKLWALFKIDTRSDPSTLDGLTLEQTRQCYVDRTGGQP